MTDIVAKIKCSRCLGTGVDNNDVETPDKPCEVCGATGYVASGVIDASELSDQIKDVEDKVDDCLDKLDDILEKLA